MSGLTKQVLAELERLEREAGCVPWEAILEADEGHGLPTGAAGYFVAGAAHVDNGEYSWLAEADAKLIVALRNNAKALIAAARRCAELERGIEELAGEMEADLERYRPPLGVIDACQVRDWAVRLSGIGEG